MEKNFIEFKMLSNKQSLEEVILQRAVKTTIEKLHDKELFDIYDNADEVLIDFLFVQ